MDVVLQVENPQHQHGDRFVVLDVTSRNKCSYSYLVHSFGLDLGVKVSGRDSLECQNFIVLIKQDQI